jgi:hypothetical protein
MATTTNYSWTTPDNTAYVKDGASAIRTLGSSVDTTLFTALGGAYPGLRLIKKQTIGSGVASVAVTGAFSADYENYKIIVNGGVGSTAQNFNLALTGGPANSYYEAGIITGYTSGTNTTLTSTNTASFRFAGSSDTNNNQMNVDLCNPFIAKVKTYFAQYSGTSTTGNGGSLSGFFNNTSSYTGFTLSVSGTVTGGTIYVYGYGAS